ncbi:hypothetical protein ScalyP_jg6416 [Parmales sp. scaly parma]|nr:hypothetical protein ScalyP_jg6416 [Parmales sp. scaly parma]
MICTVDTPITDPAVFTLDYNVCNSKHISVTIDLSVPGLGSFEDTVTAGTDDDSGSLNTGISVAGQGFYVDYTLTGETASAGLDVELVLKTTFGNTDLVGFSLPTADYTASCALNQDGYYCYDNYCVKEKYLMGAGGVAALSLLACILCVCMGRKQKNKTPKPSDMGYAPMDDKAQQYGQQQQQQQYV